MPKLLLVEDDDSLSAVLTQALAEDHFVVELSRDGTDALERLALSTYDVVILDWELPCVAGVEVCRSYRSRGGKVPILMLTGKSQLDDKEFGLDSGADDYLTKPFALRELSARIRALLRRSKHVEDDILKAHEFEMDPRQHTLLKNGKPIHLSPKEFSLFECLLRGRGEVVSAEDLLKAIWTADEEVGTETVRSHIKNLRAKIDVKGKDSRIQTVFGVGYKFDLARDVGMQDEV